MRNLYAVLFLYLAACAADAEYHRGAYRPPARAPVRAPATNPTTDAPRYAPPGHMPAPGVYPRSRHGRILPTTKEPGIWASDEPDPGNTDPVLFGVPLPVPEATPVAKDKSIAAYCAIGMETAAVASALPVNVFKLDLSARNCLAAKMYRACVETMLARAESWKTSGKAYNAEMLKRYRAVAQTARAFMAGACTEAQNANPALEEWATTIYMAWMRGALHEPQ